MPNDPDPPIKLSEGRLTQSRRGAAAGFVSYAIIKSLVTREAFVVAFNDAFLVISVALRVCAGAIWFCKPFRAEEAHSPAG